MSSPACFPASGPPRTSPEPAHKLSPGSNKRKDDWCLTDVKKGLGARMEDGPGTHLFMLSWPISSLRQPNCRLYLDLSCRWLCSMLSTLYTHTHTSTVLAHRGPQPDLCDSCREEPEDFLLHFALWRQRTLVLRCLSVWLPVSSLQLDPLWRRSFKDAPRLVQAFRGGPATERHSPEFSPVQRQPPPLWNP